MAGSYKIIDEKNWERAIHCQVFRNCIEPSYCVTFELDISHFLAKMKAMKLSFTMGLIYVVTACANKIEAFRYRFLDGRVVLYDQMNTAFTYIGKETDLFKMVNVEMQDSIEEYIAVAMEKAEQQKAYFTGPPPNDVFQFSPLPWVSYTHISHTNSGKKDNATAIFGWGRFLKEMGNGCFPSPFKCIIPL